MLDRLGASMKKHQENYLSGREIQRRVTEFQPKEPCLTPTLMDEGQVKKPYYNLKWVYNGILEVYLDMEAHIPSATQITKKEPKETTKGKGNIPNHNGPEVNQQLNT